MIFSIIFLNYGYNLKKKIFYISKNPRILLIMSNCSPNLRKILENIPELKNHGKSRVLFVFLYLEKKKRTFPLNFSCLKKACFSLGRGKRSAPKKCTHF